MDSLSLLLIHGCNSSFAESYRLSKKSWLIFYSKQLYEMGLGTYRNRIHNAFPDAVASADSGGGGN